MNTIGERLKRLRDLKGMTQQELGNKISVSMHTIMRWEKGKGSPSAVELIKIADILNTSILYFVNEQGSQPHHTAATRSIRKIPLLNKAHTSCGDNNQDNEHTNNYIEDYIDLSTDAFEYIDEARPPFAVYAEGDSMDSVNIPDGSIVIVNPAEDIRSGNIYLIEYRGQQSVKGIILHKDGSILLKAGDSAYEIEIPSNEVSDDHWFRIIGRVVRVVNISKPKSFL